MSVISFGFYVVVAYIVYYILVISYDMLTAKPANGLETDGTIQYDFGNQAPPKIAVIEGEEVSGRKQSIDFNEASVSEELSQENEMAPAVDLTLESMTASRVKLKRNS